MWRVDLQMLMMTLTFWLGYSKSSPFLVRLSPQGQMLSIIVAGLFETQKPVNQGGGGLGANMRQMQAEVNVHNMH